jgi:hypothetical protein
VRFLDAGVWSEPVTIPPSAMEQLAYFRVDIPEDVAVVKMMVDQLKGASSQIYILFDNFSKAFN